jgi:dephospho-CoA kinase
MLIIGLTGGIASGKTTAANFFAQLGAEILDTDAIGHELTQARGAAMDAIRQTFGDQFIAMDRALKRSEMRALVFSDGEARKKLEAILHPLIRSEVAHRARFLTAPYGIVVVPLLLETNGYRELIRRVLVVDCDERDQIARAIARTGLDERMVRAIMGTQLSRQERLMQADDIIRNDGDIDRLQQQVRHLHEKYLALALRNGRAI